MNTKIFAGIAVSSLTFTVSGLAKAQITANYSMVAKNVETPLWSFSYVGGTANNLSVNDNRGNLFSLGTFTGIALTEEVSHTGLVPAFIPLKIELSDGRTVESVILTYFQGGINIRSEGVKEFNLSMSGKNTVIPIDDQSFFEIRFNSSGNQSINSPTVGESKLLITSTYHQNPLPRIPEPGAISLLGLGGLTMGGMLLRRKSR